MKKKEQKNLLDIVPVKNADIDWIMIKDDIVQIVIKRDRWLDRLVRKFKKTPKHARIDLDKYGSAVWTQIDGKRDIQQIAQSLRLVFGDEIEPLYERLGAYINILNNNSFISLKPDKE